MPARWDASELAKILHPKAIYNIKVGKYSVSKYKFAKENYESFIEINFVLNPEYKTIFKKSFQVDEIIKEITLRNPDVN